MSRHLVVRAVALVVFTGPATVGPATVHLSLSPRQAWTATGISVRAGDTIDVRATGRAHFGDPPIASLSPAGIPRGATCTSITARQGRLATAWPDPALACWSLIGRIGSGRAFAIGDARTVRAPRAGKFFLGINDNYLRDNSGAWAATVTVTPVAAAPPAPRGKPPASESSNFTQLMLVAVFGIVALLVGWVLWRRRRRHTPAVTAPVAAARTVTPAAPDPTDVNIIEVEFPDRSSLRVGYNFFPEGTNVAWVVAHHDTELATGAFVADGGGATNHFVTLELDTELPPDPDGADVTFTWEIGRVRPTRTAGPCR
jgi:hypothetical protein